VNPCATRGEVVNVLDAAGAAAAAGRPPCS